MKTIDSHTHFYPEFVAARPVEWAHSAGENYWALLVGKRPDGRKSLQGFPSEKKFLCDMDKAGVERAIIQGWYWQNSGTCEMMNYEISKFVKAHPDRLSAFISIQPANAERSIETVKRARDDGFCGIGEIHDGVQKTLDALVAVGTAAKHGGHRHLDGALADRLFELLLGDGLAFVHDALLEDGVIEICRLLDEFPARFGSPFRHIGGDVALRDRDAVVLARVVESFHGDEIDDPFEIALAADGEHDGHGIGAQSLVHHPDDVVKVRSVDVHFVDEGDAGHLVGVGLTPHVFGLRLHAALGAEHRDRSVQHPEASFDFNGKVDVSGSVDDVDLMTFPHGGRGCGSDGDPPLSLLHHVVHNRCAVVHLTEFARHARIEQDALRGRGLTGVDVSHDADVPDLVKCKVALHRDYHL